MPLVIFVQLPPPRFDFSEAPSNIPLAAGFLSAALDAARIPNLRMETLGSDTVDVYADAGLSRKIVDMQPSLLAMTLYLWNSRRSLFLAANVKRIAPSVRVIVGGPEVTQENRWILDHPAVDAGVFGEGESRISDLVRALLAGDSLAGIQGVFFKDDRGTHLNTAAAQPWDLAACPYPYLDRRIGPSPDGGLFLETVRGCAFRCRYCFYHKAFNGIRRHPPESINAALEMAYSAESPVREIYLMDPTFNTGPGFRDILRRMAELRSRKQVSVHTELRAELLQPHDVGLFKDAGLKSAEVGLQSVNPVALEMAGRPGDPADAARGVELLKKAGVEVTTGIILGLPGDDPQGFSATLEWLKVNEAYSVVHPFVLSVLPGTDFRENARGLGLEYDQRPPYYVRSTKTFPAEAFQPALLECQSAFDMELDHIPLPSLVDKGLPIYEDPGQPPYISKCIIGPEGLGKARKLWGHVIDKATDPFTLWFKGPLSEREAMLIVQDFALANPHAVLAVVLEMVRPPRTSFFERILQAAADPHLCLNKSYAPLYGGDSVVSPDFTVVLPDPGDPAVREKIDEELGAWARLVWDAPRPPRGDFTDSPRPLLVSWAVEDSDRARDTLFGQLETAFGDAADEALFRDFALQAEWNKRSRGIDLRHRLTEMILVI
jgi:radical SAM superfamily enzyme YgiQ (UPF0313 family)